MNSAWKTREALVYGLRVFYDVAGEGPVILFIHGWAGSRQHWREASRYLPNYKVIAPDLFGFGDSEEFELGASEDDYLQLLRSLLTSLGVEYCTVVGHSVGGQIAARLAGKPETPVSKLVLVEAPVSHELRSVKCPILLVFGEENDERTAIALGQREQNRLANGIFIRRASHNVMLDQPAEFYKILGEWLSGNQDQGVIDSTETLASNR